MERRAAMLGMLITGRMIVAIHYLATIGAAAVVGFMPALRTEWVSWLWVAGIWLCTRIIAECLVVLFQMHEHLKYIAEDSGFLAQYARKLRKEESRGAGSAS